MRSPIVSLSACSAAALVLAGCGGGPRLPVLTALQLSRLADRHDCGGLVHAAIAAVNRGEVPGPLQEPVVAAANECRFPTSLRP